jgi:hypothetical protein
LQPAAVRHSGLEQVIMFIRPRVQRIAGCDASQPEAQTAVVPVHRRYIACNFLSRPAFGRKVYKPKWVNYEPRGCAQSDGIAVIEARKERG